MDTLRKLLEALRDFSPEPIRDNGGFLTACRLTNEAGQLYMAADFHTVLIVEGELNALALAGEGSNCIFAIGAENRARFLNCAASVVFFPNETDGRALFAAVSRALREASGYAQAREVLLEAFFDHAGLKRLVTLAEDALGSPLAIFDIANAPLALGARFRSLTGDAALNEYREKGYISFNFAKLNMFRDFLQAMERATAPFTFVYGDAPLLPRRVHKIYVNGAFIAHCTMALDRELRPGDDAFLEFFCQLVKQELERTAYNPYKNDWESVVLQELLDGVHPTEAAFQARVELFDWELCRNFYLLNIPRRREPGAAGGSLFIPTILLQELRFRMPPQTASVRHLIDPERILLLVDMKKPGVMENFQAELEAFLRSDGLLCAMSHRFEHILDFKKQTERTEALLQVGAGIGVRVGLLDGKKLFFQRIAYDLREKDLESCCLPELLELRAKPSGGELLHTVYVYLDTGRSVKDTAERLFIHRNTLLRRLARFQELTGLKLENGGDGCKLYMSFKLLEFSDNYAEGRRNRA